MEVATYQGREVTVKPALSNHQPILPACRELGYKHGNDHCIHIWHNLPFCTRLELGVSSIGT